MDVLNPQAPLVVHIDNTNLACTMATVMSKKERYKKLGDIIKHTKKYVAYDFYNILDPNQASKWVKTMEKACTTF